MTHAPKLRTFLPLASVAVALILASQARVGSAAWFGWGTPTTVTTGYAPGYGYYYAPTTSYRTLYSPVAVTSYRPVSACSACGAPAVTSYMPVTTYVQRPVLQAYTSYQPVCAAPAPACGSCGCSTCGCSSCGCARPACSSCGGGCANGNCGAALAPSAAPTLSYMTPSSSTTYSPSPVYANASSSYPVAAAYTTPAYSAPQAVTYPAPTYTPTYVGPAPQPTGPINQTYTMPLSPNSPPGSSSVVRPSAPTPGPTPTLAPPAPGPTSADVAPSLDAAPPAPQPPASSTQPQNSASPPAPPSDTPKTFGDPTVPSSPSLKPIPDTRPPAPPSASGTHPPLDPNSRTASSMPMMRPGSYPVIPWPIAKTTAALMPVVADDADGWHAVK